MTRKITKLWNTDPHVEKFFNWSIQRIGKQEWASRKIRIQSHLRKVVQGFKTPKNPNIEGERLSYSSDLSGWYLYLTECYLYMQDEYEYLQGSRVIPYFSILGESLDLLKIVKNFEDKIDKLLYKGNKSPDQDMFELLIAILYVKSGYEEVTFIKETPQKKTPDLSVKKGGKTLYVECKRFNKSSDYTELERKAWLRIWKPFALFLSIKNKHLILDITFHIEIIDKDSDYLISKVSNIIDSFTSGLLIDDSEVTIKARKVEKDRINKQLEIEPIKLHSPQLGSLITGSYHPLKGLAIYSGYKTGSVNISNTNILNTYTLRVNDTVAAYRSFESEVSTNKKARSIMKRLSTAEDQIPDYQTGIVHIGIETLDGDLTSKKGFDKIKKSLKNYQVRGDKEIACIFCHFLQPESPPDDIFDFVETTAYFPKDSSIDINSLLSYRLFSADKDGQGEADNVHWNM